MNKWLKKNHLKQIDYSFTICDNYHPIQLTTYDAVFEEMPIIRSNWTELESSCHCYWNQCELQQRNERLKKWANVYTSL